MTLPALGLIVSLGTFALVVVVVRACCGPLKRAALTRARDGRCRPDDLLLVRLAPVLIALVTLFVLVVPAFLRFEPRGRTETAGGPVLFLAAIGAAFLIASSWRVVRDLFRTRALTREWLSRGTPFHHRLLRVPAFIVDTPDPLVAVTGVVRPRLFVSRRVLTACEAAELEAIIEHEAGHLGAADNVKRLLLRACPDSFRRRPEDLALERVWSAASEDAADDAAGRRGVDGVDLASALVSVARLGPAPRLEAIASGFHESDDVERRVRRALSGAPGELTPPWLRLRLAGLALLSVTAATVAAPGALAGVHEIIELAVAFLR
jgi:hypothetical protein